MRIATVIVAAALAAPVWAEDKPALKELPTKDLKIAFDEGAKANAPAEIKTADALAKSALKGSADAVKKNVDFAKEKVVVFMWQGSGGDRITGAVSKDGKTAEFAHTFGLTFDLRQHTKVFVVPKDATVKYATVK